MNYEVVNKITAQYDSLTAIINKVSKSNDKDFIELKKQWETFGELLHQFLLEYLEEVEEFKKSLNAQKAESDEIINQLNEKMAGLKKSIPVADYQYYSKVCQKEYSKYWGLLEESTKQFLTTGYYVLHIVKAKNADFSVVVVELAKAIEEEMTDKLYSKYLAYRTKPLPHAGGAFGKVVSNYITFGKGFIPFRLMFNALNLPRNQNQNDYYNDLQRFIRAQKWNTKILNSDAFIDGGIDYSYNYRNEAAHCVSLTETTAMNCKKETIKLLSSFLSAYHSKK